MKVVLMFLVLTLTFSLYANSNAEKESDLVASGDFGLFPEEGAVLKVWDSAGIEGDFMKKIAEEFTEKYGIKVIFEEVSHMASVQRLLQDGPAGVGADVFAAPHNMLGQAVSAGLIFPNIVGADRLNSEYVDVAKLAVTSDGVLYGYPTVIETYAMFYNKNIFPEPPKTYDEIKVFAKEYNDINENKFAFMWDVSNAYFSHSFIAGYGGYVFGNNGTDENDIGLNRPEAKDGLKEMMSLKSILPLKSGDANYGVMDGLFQEGKIGAIINGAWALKQYLDSDLDIGVAPLPILSNGNHPLSFSGIRGLYVSAFTQYPKAAQMFAIFSTSDEVLNRRLNETGMIPPIKTIMASEEVVSDKLFAPFIEQIQYSVPMPSITAMDLVWAPYQAAFASVWNGDQQPEEALDKAVNLIQESMASQEE